MSLTSTGLVLNIKDDFLSKEDHQKLLRIFHDDIEWRYNKNVVYDGEDSPEEYALVTSIYSQGWVMQREVFDILKKYVNADSWIRIKANFGPKRTKVMENALHVDYKDTFTNQWTAVYYLTTNNGYTYFEDGQRVDSVANRLVVFPVDTMHSGTTSTDNNRIVINLNWIGSVVE